MEQVTVFSVQPEINYCTSAKLPPYSKGVSIQMLIYDAVTLSTAVGSKCTSYCKYVQSEMKDKPLLFKHMITTADARSKLIS